MQIVQFLEFQSLVFLGKKIVKKQPFVYAALLHSREVERCF